MRCIDCQLYGSWSAFGPHSQMVELQGLICSDLQDMALDLTGNDSAETVCDKDK